jgi:voltage-gated potassium channel Kch
MPWESVDGGIRFSGHLTDLMTTLMSGYDADTEAGKITAEPGVYITAAAIVIREILLEQLASSPEAAEFLDRVGDSLTEDPDGTVSIQTFALLDDVAEHIERVAWEQWLADPAARAAIAEVASNAFTG